MDKFDPHSNQWLLNKFEIYKELRNSSTAHWSNKYQMYIITRYDDVIYALNNPEIFSSAKGNLIVESPNRFGNTLGASDNPTHDLFKNIVRKAYSKDNIDRIVNCFSTHAKQLLSQKGILNLSEIIDELSAWVSTEIINLPYDKEEIKNLIVSIQRHSSRCVSINVDDTDYDKFVDIIVSLIKNKVAPNGPGIYNEYLTNNPEKIKSKALFTGPIISGASSLTGGLQFLTLDLCRENKLDILLIDRNLIPNAVNESFRFLASTGRFSRTVTQPVTLHGIDLKPNDRVALCLESANRDPNKFPDPEKFVLERNTAGQLAFGHGLHACIAMAISKAVMTEYLTILLDIVGKYRIVTTDFKYVMTASGNDDMISNISIEKE